MADFTLRPVEPVRIAMDDPRYDRLPQERRRERDRHHGSGNDGHDVEYELDAEGEVAGVVVRNRTTGQALRYSASDLSRLAEEAPGPGRLFERRG